MSPEQLSLGRAEGPGHGQGGPGSFPEGSPLLSDRPLQGHGASPVQGSSSAIANRAGGALLPYGYPKRDRIQPELPQLQMLQGLGDAQIPGWKLKPSRPSMITQAHVTLFLSLTCYAENTWHTKDSLLCMAKQHRLG